MIESTTPPSYELSIHKDKKKIIDFLNENGILWFPIKLEIIKTNEILNGEVKMKKKLVKLNHPAYANTKGYRDFENVELVKQRQQLLEIKNDFNYIWIDTNQVRQIDIDTNKNIPEYINKLLDNLPYFKSATKSYGKHIFIKTNVPFDKCIYKFLDNEDIEFLTGQGSFCPIDADVINATSEHFVCFDDGWDKILKNYKIEDAKEYADIEYKTITQFHKDILENINGSYYTSYTDWIRFLWAIKFSFENTDEALQLANFYSQKIEGYKGIDDVKYKFNEAKEKRISWSYLMTLSKKSNEIQHYKIISKYEEYLKLDDYYIAKIALHLTQYKVIKNEGNIYVFISPFWVNCSESKYDGKFEKIVSDELRNFYTDMYSQEIIHLKSEDEIVRERATKKIKCIEKILTRVNGKGLESICKRMKIEMEDVDIKFDTYKPFYFCFKDGTAFDLKTNKKVEIKPHHYITQHTTYEYSESPKEDVELIKMLIMSIFPEKDARECYISILRTGMIGQSFEKFILANGVGGNGKGLLNELMSSMLGNIYYYKGNITTLTQEIKGGSNPELANMDKKRFVVITEPNDTTKLQLGQIKDITGGKTINARKNYSNKTDVSLMLTLVLECNKKPKINGRIDSSALRRFVNIFFPSVFTNDKNLLKCKNHYPKNEFYKTDEFQERYKFALFHYLLEYEYINIYEPKSILNSTKEYLFENDEFDNVLHEYIEITDNKNDYVPLKQLKNIFRDMAYREGSRNYRQFTNKTFLEKANESIIWKTYISLYYRERVRIEGKNVKGFTNMKVKENIDDEEDDE